MIQYKQDTASFDRRSVTLNSLKEQQFSLNMRMLLAMQTHNEAAQKDLKGQLIEVQKEIERLCLGSRFRP